MDRARPGERRELPCERSARNLLIDVYRRSAWAERGAAPRSAQARSRHLAAVGVAVGDGAGRAGAGILPCAMFGTANGVSTASAWLIATRRSAIVWSLK